MQALYPYFLTLHLICAIIFVGYLFCDVLLLSPLKKAFDSETSNKIFNVILKRGVKIMPLCLLLLILSGGAMISRWVGAEKGFFESTLQQLLMLKVALVVIIAGLVVFSLVYRFALKRANPLGKVIHPIALVLGLCIAVLAKMAFYL